MLEKIEKVAGNKTFSQFQLQVAPSLIVEKSIQAEKDAYAREQVFREVQIRELPKSPMLFQAIISFRSKWMVIRTKERLNVGFYPM